jgi:hypothetical protein
MRRSNKFGGVSYPLPALTADTAARSRELTKQDRLPGEPVSPCSRESVEEKDGRAWPKINRAAVCHCAGSLAFPNGERKGRPSSAAGLSTTGADAMF